MLSLSLFTFHSCTKTQLRPLTNQVDWESFLGQHDLEWTSIPKTRDNSAFLGNGLIGSTIWSARDEALHWDLGRNDVYETGSRQFRMPIGKLILKTSSNSNSEFSMRQSLYRAEVTGTMMTDKGSIKWRSMIPHDRDVGLTEFTVEDGETIGIDFYQLPAANSNGMRNGLRDLIGAKLDGTPYRKIVDFSEPAYEPYFNELYKNKDLFCHPPAESGTEGDSHWLIQPFKEGGGYVVAYGLKNTGEEKVLMAYTIDYFMEGEPSATLANSKVNEALAAGYQSAVDQHYQWWDSYYRQSFVSIPHQDAEGFYWLQMYKIASATKEEGVVLDQIGPWLRATAWARVWNNTNIQIAYHSMMTSNRLEYCEPFVQLINNNYENFELAVPEELRAEGVLAIGRTMDLHGVTSWNSEYGNLSWVLHTYWLYCRYSGRDELILSDLFPLLKGAARFMINSLEKDKAGVYHFPPDISPEYGKSTKYKDVTYDLCLFRWNIKMLLHLNEKYKLNDREAELWQEVLENIMPYPVNENGLMIGSETPFAESHRHYSHIMPFFPLREMDPDDPDGLFLKTFEHWESMPQKWNLFAHFGAASMSGWLRNGDKAIRHIEDGMEEMTPNSFFPGPGPAIESVLCGVTPIGEMLIQSWTYDPDDYIIRIFPALPGDWDDACFYKLATEGAFEVSAVRKDGKLQFVEITSLAGKPCRIEADFPEGFKVYGTRSFKISTEIDRGSNISEIDLKKGETVQLVSSGFPDTEHLSIVPVH